MGYYRLSCWDEGYLLGAGYEKEDLPQIAWSCDTCKYTLYTKEEMENAEDGMRPHGTPLDRKEAQELVGYNQWLNGVARASFHRTAARNVEGSEDYVLFEDTTKIGETIPRCYF